MSILKVNTIQDKGGNNLLVSDGAGTISSGGLMTNTPAFSAELSSAQSLATGTNVTMICDSELIDTDSGYNTSTGAYTIPTGKGGVYFFHCYVRLDTGSDSDRLSPAIRVNGGIVATTNSRQNEEDSCYVTKIHTCSVGDVISWTVFHNVGSTVNTKAESHSGFMGFRLIGA